MLRDKKINRTNCFIAIYALAYISENFFKLLFNNTRSDQHYEN